MKRLLAVSALIVVMIGLFVPFAFAEEAAKAAASASDAKLHYYTLAALGCSITMGIAAFGAAISQGMSLSKACEGIARNPGASGKITTTLIIGLAMIESLAIYALVVVLIILLMNPFKI